VHAALLPTTQTTAPAGTPRAAPDSQSRHAVDALHGAALAVASLLVASARSALGVPSRLPRSAFWIAKRMILQVRRGPTNPAACFHLAQEFSVLTHPSPALPTSTTTTQPPSQPYCSAHWAAAAERDAGYLLLGALCAGGASADILVGLSRASLKRGAGGDALSLFAVALGPGAKEALDDAT
jgi:hypothetical protein